jgi:hypothetical protein
MKFGWGRWNKLSQPFVLLVSLLYRKNIYNPDAIPEHDKECCVRVCDMHATYPVAKVFGVPCGQGIFELDQVLLDDPSVFFRQAVNVLEHVPIDLEVQIASPHLVSVHIHRHYPCGQNRPPLQPLLCGQCSPVVSAPAPAGQQHLHTALQVV